VTVALRREREGIEQEIEAERKGKEREGKGREGKERKGKGKREKERRKMGDKKDKNSSCISSMITLTHTRDYKKRIVVLHPEFLPFLRYIFPFSILFAMYHCSSALSSVFFSFSVFFIFFYFIFFYFFFFFFFWGGG